MKVQFMKRKSINEKLQLRPPALAIIAFNRPEKLEQLLASLKNIKFRAVYTIVDGPREGNLNDKENVKAVIDLINNYSWNCPLHKNISKNNLGCKKRVATGLDWVFKNEDDAIILEDDILADPSFFPYANQLLDKYRSDTRIMHISGCNLQNISQCGDDSYYFSRYPYIWGWATWARAWKYYSFQISDWPENKSNFINLTFRKNTAKNWSLKLDRAFNGSLDTWDFQWLYTIMMQNGLCINPSHNLIVNTGFDINATHLTIPFISKNYNHLLHHKIKFPLKHPSLNCPNTKLDIQYEKTLDPYWFYKLKDYVYHEWMKK